MRAGCSPVRVSYCLCLILSLNCFPLVDALAGNPPSADGAKVASFRDAAIPGIPGIPELLEIHDPLQGMNRAVFEFNDFFILYAVRPLSFVYTSIIPEYLRERLDNIDNNLQMPRKVLSNLFRARWEAAGIEFYRFLINTTIGIAGAYDPAAEWWDIMSYDSSFAAAFADWGIPPGIILFIPIYGGITSTDIFGKLLDLAADPLFWVSLFVLPFPIGISIGGGFTLNSVSLSLDEYIRLRESAADPYITFRDFIYVRRIYEFWH